MCLPLGCPEFVFDPDQHAQQTDHLSADSDQKEFANLAELASNNPVITQQAQAQEDQANAKSGAINNVLVQQQQVEDTGRAEKNGAPKRKILCEIRKKANAP